MSYLKSPKIRTMQSVGLVLLIIIGVVNYMDRATLSIGNTVISEELSLTKTQMGVLLSAFSLTYAFAQLPAGILLDRFGARRVLTLSLFIWSVAQMLGGFVQTLRGFFVSRLVLGLGEAPQFPAAAKSIAEWFNMTSRGRAMGTFNASAALGTAIAPPVLTALMLTFGWRWMFGIMGVAGIVLSIIWYVAYRDRGDVRLTAADEQYLDKGALKTEKTRPSLREWVNLFAWRSTWGILLGFMGVIYMIWMYLTWLPAFLSQQYHISLTQTGWLIVIPYIFAIIGSVSSGYISDHLIKRGVGPIFSRKILVAGGLVGTAIFTVPAAYASTAYEAIAYVAVAQLFVQIASGSSWILVTSIVPSRQASSLGGIQNFGGYLAGSSAPIITGYVADATGHFQMAFVVAAAVAICAAFAHLLLVKNPIGTHQTQDSIGSTENGRQEHPVPEY